MTIHLPKDLESSIRAEVLSGHFASETELVAAAVRAYLERRPNQSITDSSGSTSRAANPNDLQALGENLDASDKCRNTEPTSQELQQRLLEAGIISEIKPPITDLAPYQNRQAILVQGEPLSEAVIRERR